MRDHGNARRTAAGSAIKTTARMIATGCLLALSAAVAMMAMGGGCASLDTSGAVAAAGARGSSLGGSGDASVQADAAPYNPSSGPEGDTPDAGGGARPDDAPSAREDGPPASPDGGDAAAGRDAPPAGGGPSFPAGPTRPFWWGQPVPPPDLTRPPLPDFGHHGFAGAVTGGEGGMEVTVTTFADLAARAAAVGKLVIKVSGKITGSGAIRVSSDKTIFGTGADAQLDASGFVIRDARNVIIRNLIISNYRPEDGVKISGPAASNIWIDHCEFFTAPLVDEATKDEFDGAIDITDGARFVTISWNHFHDTWKTSLIGSSDSDRGSYEVTYHHNYFRQIGSRVPLLRFGTAHIYDNYYREVVITGINSRMGAQALVENNYFERVAEPLVSVDSPLKGGILERNNLFFPPVSKLATAPIRAALPGTLMTIPYQHPLDPAEKVPALTVNWGGVGKIAR
jgi:pectate lyase